MNSHAIFFSLLMTKIIFLFFAVIHKTIITSDNDQNDSAFHPRVVPLLLYFLPVISFEHQTFFFGELPDQNKDKITRKVKIKNN